MKTALAALLFAICACGPSGRSSEVGPPPVSRTEALVETIHGVEIPDPYRWLEDQDAAETGAWIDEQNRYTDSVLSRLPARQELTDQVRRFFRFDTYTLPIARHGRAFFTKIAADDELAVIYMREGLDGEDQPLVDPHFMGEDHTTSVTIAHVSRDGKYVVYEVRRGGVDETEIRIRDVDTGVDLPDVLPTSRYVGATLTPDGGGLYYTRFDEDGPRILHHTLGEDLSIDEVVYSDNPDKILFAILSEDGKWLVVHSFHGPSGPSDIHIKNLELEDGWRRVTGDDGSRSFAQVVGGALVIQTDRDSPGGSVMLADPRQPAIWKTLVPELDDGVLQEVLLAGGRLFTSHLRDVLPVVSIYDLEGNRIGEIGFDTMGTVEGMNGSWDSDEVFFQFSSYHVPPTVYRYDVASAVKNVFASAELPGDTHSMALEQVTYESRDGTEVPMFILHQRGVELDGENPTLLEGYGGFNVSNTPRLNLRASVWVAGGGVYASPSLRGGGELGESWHLAGTLENKQNVFDDFIAAAEWLIANRYTSPERLGIQGESNGGLLVGASMIQRPDLFGAAVCSHPLLDMIRYHLFMMGPVWVSEYGSSEDRSQFEYIQAYSPYQNVEKGVDYPATLFITGDGDTRVAPLHARKMTARLQAASGGRRPILLRYHRTAGHSGGMPASRRIEQMVEVVGFLKWHLGSP